MNIFERLQALCPLPLKIDWHENRTTYFSARRARGVLHLRLHALFLKSPTPVLEALARLAFRRDPKALAIVRKMAHLHFSQTQAAPKAMPSKGLVYDLQEIADRIRERYFTPEIAPAIGWAASRTGRFRFMTFGSYDRHRNQIRIHKLLDSAEVPPYFVEFIVYHEMLHAVCPAKVDAAGRCRVH